MHSLTPMSHTSYDKDYNRDVIKQYQRLEQRNKIGLPTSKIREKKDQDQIKIDSEAREFFEKNIETVIESFEEINEIEIEFFLNKNLGVDDIINRIKKWATAAVLMAKLVGERARDLRDS